MVAVVAGDEVEAVLVVVEPVAELVPVVPGPVVPEPLVVEVPAWAVVDVLLELVVAPVATTDVRGRSVTSVPAAFTAT